MTRLGIKPKSTAPEVYALTTRPSELLNWIYWLLVRDLRNLDEERHHVYFKMSKSQFDNILSMLKVELIGTLQEKDKVELIGTLQEKDKVELIGTLQEKD